MIRTIAIILLAAFILPACQYNKVLKSNDLEYKYGKAMEYFNDGKCLKALPLFEELITLYRGTAKSEIIYYNFARTHYCLEDYILAAYYFKQFTNTFPNSQYTEECAYLSAYCHYLESPNYSLDQSDTQTAITELQLFLDTYPNTAKKDTINTLVKDLRGKLELKSFELAKLYVKTMRYKSAVVALKNTLDDYPDTKFREEIMFMIVKSNYELAINSISSKKEDRLLDTIKSYHTFVDVFEQSEFMKEAEGYYENAQVELKKIENL